MGYITVKDIDARLTPEERAEVERECAEILAKIKEDEKLIKEDEKRIGRPLMESEKVYGLFGFEIDPKTKEKKTDINDGNPIATGPYDEVKSLSFDLGGTMGEKGIEFEFAIRYLGCAPIESPSSEKEPQEEEKK